MKFFIPPILTILKLRPYTSSVLISSIFAIIWNSPLEKTELGQILGLLLFFIVLSLLFIEIVWIERETLKFLSIKGFKILDLHESTQKVFLVNKTKKIPIRQYFYLAPNGFLVSLNHKLDKYEIRTDLIESPSFQKYLGQFLKSKGFKQTCKSKTSWLENNFNVERATWKIVENDKSQTQFEANFYQNQVRNNQPLNIELKKGAYCYYNIAEKWNAMISDPDAVNWGAKLIINLLNTVDSLNDKDDTMKIYQTSEWKEIAEKCGPIESAWKASCPSCSQVNIGFYVSGFLDQFYLINYEAKSVTWQSVYKDGAVIPNYDKCSNCNSVLLSSESVSPYTALKDYKIIKLK
jgi:hypothetical protein